MSCWERTVTSTACHVITNSTSANLWSFVLLYRTSKHVAQVYSIQIHCVGRQHWHSVHKVQEVRVRVTPAPRRRYCQPSLSTQSLIMISEYDDVVFLYPLWKSEKAKGGKERQGGRERNKSESERKWVHRKERFPPHLLVFASCADTDIQTVVKRWYDVHMTVCRSFSGPQSFIPSQTFLSSCCSRNPVSRNFGIDILMQILSSGPASFWSTLSSLIQSAVAGPPSP